MCPNLEGRDEFVLHVFLVNFKQKLNISNEKLINVMKINPDLSHVKCYDSIDKEIIKYAVNRNGECFSNYAYYDMPQDAIKGTNLTLEHKPSVSLGEEEEHSVSTEVSKHENLATKNSRELKDDGANRNEDITIK